MASVHLFSYGPLTPITAVIFSATGCLLGIMLAARARRLSGRARTRLLIYATLAIALAGVWQPQSIGLIGLSVPASVLRFELWPLAASLAAALVGVGAGLWLIGRARPARARGDGWRFVGAGALLALGIAAGHVVCTLAIRTRGGIEREPALEIVAAACAVAAASAAVWLAVTPGRLRRALFGAGSMALSILGMQSAGMGAIRVRPDADAAATVPGVHPIFLVGAAILCAAISVMLWYFSVGNARIDDLRASFSASGDRAEIEPWMLQEISARIAVGIAPVMAARPGEFPMTAAPGPRNERAPRPITPVWRTVPMWRSASTVAGPLDQWHGPNREPRSEPADERTWTNSPGRVGAPIRVGEAATVGRPEPRWARWPVTPRSAPPATPAEAVQAVPAGRNARRL